VDRGKGEIVNEHRKQQHNNNDNNIGRLAEKFLGGKRKKKCHIVEKCIDSIMYMSRAVVGPIAIAIATMTKHSTIHRQAQCEARHRNTATVVEDMNYIQTDKN